MNNERHKRIIACGMYGLSKPLRNAWSALFQPLDKMLNQLGVTEQIHSEVIFSTSDQTYNAPQLLLGHTCGYPYMKKWQQTHRLVAVPEFDVEGCNGKHYSSWIISRSDDPRKSLEDYRGCTIAINGTLSNSGMNVFRHALYKYARNGRFAKKVTISGGHLQSLEAVANGSADLAAVDVVSYHHIAMTYPSLAQNVSIIEQSAWTPGLPFICHRNERISSELLLDAMNLCLQQLAETHRYTIGLKHFSAVDIEEYKKVILIEDEAKRAGYPTLN